jgi:hypothetical protein
MREALVGYTTDRELRPAPKVEYFVVMIIHRPEGVVLSLSKGFPKKTVQPIKPSGRFFSYNAYSALYLVLR